MKKTLLLTSIMLALTTPIMAYDKTPTKDISELLTAQNSICRITNHQQREDVEITAYGTGFAMNIGDDQYIITNKHVIASEEGFSSTYAWSTKDRTKEHTAILVYSSLTDDIAILQPIDHLPSPKYQLANKPVELGDYIYTIGYPGSAMQCLQNGTVSNIEDYMEIDETTRYYTLYADVTPGMSGSPVFVHDGKKMMVAGIITAYVGEANAISVVLDLSTIKKNLEAFNNESSR
jgi:S1-C subfamily serine protease